MLNNQGNVHVTPLLHCRGKPMIARRTWCSGMKVGVHLLCHPHRQPYSSTSTIAVLVSTSIIAVLVSTSIIAVLVQ